MEIDSDKATEYFQIKKILKGLRADLADIQKGHGNYQELQKLAKEVKKLRDEMNEEEEIKLLKEKISEQKERMDLVKELIRIQLIENSEEKIVKQGKVLKLVYIIKEAKEDKEK